MLGKVFEDNFKLNKFFFFFFLKREQTWTDCMNGLDMQYFIKPQTETSSHTDIIS